MIRIYIMLVGLLMMGPWCYAQQEVMFTQYMFNGLALNPAYAGSHEVVSMTGIARQQWIGLDGAPSTQTFSIHSPIKSNRIGIGLLLLHDKIGPINRYNVSGSYAYRIPLKHGKLAMGLRAGMNLYKIDYSQQNQNDPAFRRSISAYQPNFGAGLYYYTDRFYAGFSVPQLLERTYDQYEIDLTDVNTDSRLVRHYFFTTGYVIDLNQNLKLKPSTLLKVVEGAPIQLDLNANLLVMEVLWVGLSWRSFDSVDGILQLQLTDRLQFGYAYDFSTTSEVRSVNSGSHEISLNYQFTIGHKKAISPRYF